MLDLERASALNPADAEAQLMRGDICLEQKDRKKAKEAYEKAVRLGIPRAELLGRLEKCK